MIARTLGRRILLRTTHRRVFRALQYLECTPEVVGVAAVDLVIEIEPHRGWYRIVETGAPVKEAFDATAVVDQLQVRLFALSLEDRPQTALLNAACLRHRGRRILLVGDEGSGKTPLTLRLLCAGYHFEGDERVFLQRGSVTSRPRACRVRDSALPGLAEIADVIRSAPSWKPYLGQTTFNLDPRLVGGDWRIESGPVDFVIVLEPNHGGYSSIRRMRPLMLAKALMGQLAVPENGRGPAVAAVAALVSRARGFDLSLGEHEGAVRCFDRIFSEHAASETR